MPIILALFFYINYMTAITNTYLQTEIDNTTNPLYTYIGKAAPNVVVTDAKRQIYRVTNATGKTNYANLDAWFTFIYNSRTSYTY